MYIHLRSARLKCNCRMQAPEAFSAWVEPGDLLLQTPQTGTNTTYWKKYYFRHVTLMLWGKVEAGLWIVFPFSRITEQNLKPHIRIKYKFSDEMANEKGNSFVLADYVFTFNTMQWPNCAVDLTLFKVIWYWSAFRYNATAIKPIKCNATQIWFFRHIISMRNHHIAEKASRLAKAYLSCLVSFSTFWYICIEFYF